jgi:hypothetical protein
MLQHVLSKKINENVSRLQQTKKVDLRHYTGPNRRLSTLLPAAANAAEDKQLPARHLMQREFMLTLGANESTCVLHISSQWRRSRSSVLVFRGRALGCIYTRKDLDAPMFGEEAYSFALADLGNVDTHISAYEIEESVALAAAALFSRHTLAEEPTNLLPIDEYKKFLDIDASGCIFLNNAENQTVCRIYVLDGTIVGIYANAEGWIETDINLVEEMVEKNPSWTCESFMMKVENIASICDDAFPLSAEGHAIVMFDGKIRKSEKRADLFANCISSVKRHCNLLDKAHFVDEQQNRIEQVTAFANRTAAIKHAHSVHPLV